MKNKLFKKFAIMTILLIGLLAISTVGVFAQNERNDDDKPGPEMAKQAKITPEQARAIALAKIPGTIIDAELEVERGRLQYAIDVKDANGVVSDVEIDAKTGAVLQAIPDDDDDKNGVKNDDDDDESPAVKQANMAKYGKDAKITMIEARAIALKRIPGTITEEDLEKERGVLQYSFDIKTADGKIYDVEIDAESGKILKAVIDTDDDDDN